MDTILKEHIVKCFDNVEKDIHNVSDECFNVDGMSGKMTRKFFNNLGTLEDVRYLEVGSYKGSTMCSILSNNSLNKCTCIDNWSQFNGPKEECISNFNTFKGDNQVIIHEMHCFHNSKFGPKTMGQPKPNEIGKYNIYFYDGHHTEDSQYMGLYHYLPAMDDTFIFICDDWNWEKVRKGTYRAIEEAKLEILYKKEIRLTFDDSHTPAPERQNTWWNGLAVFLFKQ
tara:strand:- start:3930 stop:4607 length:678 start_codon:yes stop_codon:yes gene_type:complete